MIHETLNRPFTVTGKVGNVAGWRIIFRSEPLPIALGELEKRGVQSGITQNVDGLHRIAGNTQ